MNTARRSMLKFFPLAPLAFAGVSANAEELVKTEPTLAELPQGKDTKAVFCFRCTQSVRQENLDVLRTHVREMLDAAGLKDSLSFVLPQYVELDVFVVPRD